MKVSLNANLREQEDLELLVRLKRDLFLDITKNCQGVVMPNRLDTPPK